MTLQQATLPVHQFDQIQLADLKQQIEQTIQNGQNFLNQLNEVPQNSEAQLATLTEVDQLENNMRSLEIMLRKYSFKNTCLHSLQTLYYGGS